MRLFIVRLILFCFLFFTVERFCHKQTHGFRLHKIHSTLTYDPKRETTPLSKEEWETVDSLLSQPYHFLESGGECYVFESEDRKAVLKFFKHHHMRSESILDRIWIPPLFDLFRVHFRDGQKEKLNKFFTSCLLADTHFREGTGLLYLHLNKTEHLGKKLHLFDPIGVLHTLNLDQVEFALQKKAQMAYPTLSALAQAGELEGAKKRLSSLLDLIEKRCQAGIADHDARKRNFGFVGQQAIELDLGSFSKNPTLAKPEALKKTLLLETVKLRRWLKKYHPELTPFFDESMKERLNRDS